MVRSKYWAGSVWTPSFAPGNPQPTDLNSQLVLPNNGDTLVRSIVTLEVRGATKSPDATSLPWMPENFSSVAMYYGLIAIDDSSGAPVVPSAQNMGDTATDWILWSPLILKYNNLVYDTHNWRQFWQFEMPDGGMQQSLSRRGPFTGTNPGIWAALWYSDPAGLLHEQFPPFDSLGSPYFYNRFLFEAAPA